jgi:hypothetical protein
MVGSLAYYHVPKDKRTKLMTHTNLGTFVGYTDTKRVVKVYDPKKKVIKEYRDVIIDETRRWGNRIKQADNGDRFITFDIDDKFVNEAPHAGGGGRYTRSEGAYPRSGGAQPGGACTDTSTW